MEGRRGDRRPSKLISPCILILFSLFALHILARMKRLLVLFILASSAAGAASPDPAAVAAKARMWRAAHEREIVSELTTLLAIPNLASAAPTINRNATPIPPMLDPPALN